MRFFSSKYKKFFLSIIIFICFGFTFYLFYLYNVITVKFEHHRWNLPSRIYADSFALHPDLEVTAQQIDEKLEFLEYNRINKKPETHGEYQKIGNNYEIFLHRFDYPFETFEGYPISFSVQANRLRRLIRTDTGEDLSLARLEPELVALIFDNNMEDRTFVSIDRVPQPLIEAIITIEDERYYKHIGIDLTGIGRAFVKNLLAGHIVQGGSTLTQQLVKNFFLHPGRSYIRKFNEMLMALLMEWRYSKNEILEAYLNEIYLGQRGPSSIAGVEEAARYYFSKDVGQLTIAESTLLAGMIRSPGYYSPILHPKRAMERRNFILRKLLDQKKLTPEQYREARKSDIPSERKNRRTNISPFFVDLVIKRLHENFPREKLEAEGLRIFTTLEMNYQRAAYRALGKQLDQLEKDIPQLKKNVALGQQLEGAFVAIQPNTGFIRAYIGGRKYRRVQFDHITQAKRQPGSLMKPFVYLTALDPSQTSPPYTLASFLDDSPLKINSGGEVWRPQNYDNKSHGKVRLRVALTNSYNLATVGLAQNVGLEKIVETSKKAGIKSELKPYPSLALGSFEITPLEMAQAYTVFANQGVRTEPEVIRQVVTPEGEVLEKKDFEMEKVFGTDVVYLMNRLLMGVLDEGTARSARSLGFYYPAAGKTGTTSDYRDAWFAGYTPNLLALSWVGYDDNTPTGLTGATGALPIWTNFMIQAHDGHQRKNFPPSQNVIIVPIDTETGLLFNKRCSGDAGYEEYFIEGTEPKEFCDDGTHGKER